MVTNIKLFEMDAFFDSMNMMKDDKNIGCYANMLITAELKNDFERYM